MEWQWIVTAFTELNAGEQAENFHWKLRNGARFNVLTCWNIYLLATMPSRNTNVHAHARKLQCQNEIHHKHMIAHFYKMKTALRGQRNSTHAYAVTNTMLHPCSDVILQSQIQWTHSLTHLQSITTENCHRLNSHIELFLSLSLPHSISIHLYTGA